MASDDMPVDEEHFESIPWSSLVAQTDNRPWLVYVAAGAVVALVVGLLVARSFGQPAMLATPVATVTPVTPVTSQTRPPTTSVSEADLRADLFPGEAGGAAARLRAEWFVADYFTNDGADGRQSELAGALGRPTPAPEPGFTTYVEWAKAWNTQLEGDGRYRVSVAFRSLTETDRGFVRGLVHGVAVRVQVGPNGGTRVVDLPEPITLPTAPTLAELPAGQTVPDTIALQAQEVAAAWGESVSVSDGVVVDGAWHVSVEVADEHGIRWPLVVWLESGEQP